jgi:hypothetical protein
MKELWNQLSYTIPEHDKISRLEENMRACYGPHLGYKNYKMVDQLEKLCSKLEYTFARNSYIFPQDLSNKIYNRNFNGNQYDNCQFRSNAKNQNRQSLYYNRSYHTNFNYPNNSNSRPTYNNLTPYNESSKKDTR